MSIRLRLALWYGALLAVVLTAAIAAASAAHGQMHIGEVDDGLHRVLDAAAAARSEGVPVSRFVLPLELRVDPHLNGLSVLELDRSGRTLSAGGVDRGESLAQAVTTLKSEPRTVTVGGVELRVRSAPLDDGALLAAAVTLEYLQDPLARFQQLLVLIAGVGVVVALTGGWAIAGSALRPIAVLMQAVRSIADSRAFSRRVPEIDRHDELGELGRTFNDMLASLDAAHQLEQRFVSDTSHELRTPLTTVHANAELLAQNDTDAGERAEAVAQILRETRRLTRLIDELLALARADAETEPLDRTRVQLDEVLMEAFEELRQQAGQRLRVVALDEAPVLGDRDGLKQLVLILLDNALRYTPGEGCVDASVAAEDGTVVLRVEDTGIGIDPETKAHAFDRFYRADAARRVAPEGTGLGLSIARWIVSRHRGSIALLPRDPIGTCAVVRLPLGRTSADDGPARRGR